MPLLHVEAVRRSDALLIGLRLRFAVRPLDAARRLDAVVAHARDVERAAGTFRQLAHLLERALGRLRKVDLVAILEALGHLVEDPEVGLAVRIRRQHVARQVHAALGVGVAAFLLGPHRGGQEHMRILVGLDVFVDILHDEKLEVLHRLADARLIRHRGHRIRRDQPQALDLAALDGRKDVGLREAARRREEARVNAPEVGNLLAVLLFLEQAVARQP